MLRATSRTLRQVFVCCVVLASGIVLESVINRQIYPVRLHLSFALLYLFSIFSVDGKFAVAAFICGFVADQLAFARLGMHSTLLLISHVLIVKLRKNISSERTAFIAFILAFAFYYLARTFMEKITGADVQIYPVPDFTLHLCLYLTATRLKKTRAALIFVKLARP